MYFSYTASTCILDLDNQTSDQLHDSISKERPTTHKEMKLFAFFEDSTDEDGTVLRFGLCSFDRFAFVE